MTPVRTLRQCLVDTDLAHLRVIARLWGLEVQAGRKLEIAAELSQLLSDPGHGLNVWHALPEDERHMLRALVDVGGIMPVAGVNRMFGEIRPIGPGRLERDAPWRNPVSPTEGLWYRGLIFEGFAEQDRESYPVFFVPAELQAALPIKTTAEEVVIHVQTVGQPAHQTAGWELLLDDICTLLATIHNDVIRLPSKTASRWPEKTKRRFTRHLRDPSDERLDLALHLIDRLGWIRVSKDSRLRLTGEPVMSWLKQPDRAVLVSTWRNLTEWDELWRLTALQPDDSATWRHSPIPARSALLRYLNTLAPGEWIGISDFVNAIKNADPDFQRPGSDYDVWYILDPGSGAYLTGFESWDQVEGALLYAMLRGPAHWLGLVELGGESPESPPTAFRLPAAPSPAPGDEPLPLVRNDLSITMPSKCRFQRFQLARVADLVAVGDPFLYRLTPASLERARQQRIDPEKVLGFLDGLSNAPLPQPVRISLMRWASEGTEVWLEHTVLLRVTDEVVMAQILAAPKTSRYVASLVSPTAAVVQEENWPALASALAELGLLAELVGFGDA